MFHFKVIFGSCDEFWIIILITRDINDSVQWSVKVECSCDKSKRSPTVLVILDHFCCRTRKIMHHPSLSDIGSQRQIFVLSAKPKVNSVHQILNRCTWNVLFIDDIRYRCKISVLEVLGTLYNKNHSGFIF